MQLISDEQIELNEQLYSDISVDDAALINSDVYLSQEEKTSALMNPEAYKNLRLNPDIITDATKYPSVFDNMSSPNLYKISRSYQDELVRFEDELNDQQKTMGAFDALYKGFKYGYQSMKINNLQSKLRDAIHDNNIEKAESLRYEIENEQEILDNLERPNRKYLGTAGAVPASFVRMAPEILVTTALSMGLSNVPYVGPFFASITGVTKGKKFYQDFKRAMQAYKVAKRGKNIYSATKYAQYAGRSAKTLSALSNALVVYNDTANVEGGAMYEELTKIHPEWSEEDRYKVSKIYERMSAALEVSNLLLGVAGVGAKTIFGVAGVGARAGAKKLGLSVAENLRWY